MTNFDPTIESVEDHPFTIHYEHDGRQRKYSPDARLVRRGDKAPPEIIEVKLQAELEKQALKLEPAFAAARAYAAKHNEVFRVLTEKELRRPLARNLRFLFPYRKRSAQTAIEAAILAELVEPRSLNEVCSRLETAGHPRGAVIAQVWRLVALQRVATDLDKLLSLDAPLELRSWGVTV